MRAYALGVGLLGLLLAGCSADWDQASQERNAFAQPNVAAPMQASSIMPVRAPAEVAALPDRGDLVAYDKTRLPVRRGAYTWHAVQLSEEHALRAVANGDLVVTGPNGQPIHLQYERHVEHPDGNWTWIGRVPGAKPGAEAILTFGEKAVFGSIPYGDEEPLRLTTSGGRAWLMRTDRAVMARLDNAGVRPPKPDYLLPPRIARASTPGAQLFSAAQLAEAVTTTTTTTVDVLIGYTSGFASRLGGQSQATTRLTYLVDVTNQAYANSQIDAQVRLVRAMQVTYPDATPNDSALYALTGVDCTEQPDGSLDCELVGPPASLAPLHTARDQYGADLVSLVRNFNDPENESCGIAWINGGGQSNITSNDEFTGMSVVSDSNGTGPGSFPDNLKVCSDETFAHELAHNMGSQHDRATAQGIDDSNNDGDLLDPEEYGRYPYSFGHKTAAGSGNFFTVMAYGNSGQTRYRVFSNPGITYCGGHACGVANTADNARSLRQTMPIIATFRATAGPGASNARNDVDGDGKSDLLWFHPTNRVLVYWVMNGATRVRSGSQAVAVGYSPLTTGDYNGDGRLDLVMRNGAAMQMWFGNGSSFAVQSFRGYPSGWTLVASGDIDADGKSDLLWFHPASRLLAYWVLNGTTLVRSSSYLVASGYSPLTSGDYNADNRVDILWRHTSGAMQHWTGNGTSFGIVAAGTFPAGWTSIGSGDVNADGKADLLWYHPTQQKFAYWLRNGASTTGSGSQLVPAGHTPLANGDFSGDGQVDLDWKPASGAMLFWLRNGNSYAAQTGPSYPAGWSIVNGSQ